MSKRNRRKCPGDGAVAMETKKMGSSVRRKKKSKELAQKRRTSYKGIMDELAQVLPFHKGMVSQLDYNSRLRFSLCFFRLKALMASGKEEEPADEIVLPGGMSEASGVDTQAQSSGGGSSSSEVSPGILQNMMTEALDGFLMVISSDGNIVYLSESIHHHLGIFQSEHIGVSVYDIINTDDHEIVKEYIFDAVARAMTFSIRRRSNPVEFFCHMKCSRFRAAAALSKTPGFKLVHISGTMKMMTDSCYLVTVVRPVSPPSISEIRMEGNMFVTHYSMDLKCIFFDGRLQHLLGYKKLDLEGHCAFNFHHHEDCDATVQCSQTLIRQGEVLSCYYRFLSQLGFYVWLQTRGAVMYNARTAKPSYIVCLNYIISKEAGEKDFTLRHAVTTGGNDIAEGSNHSYDPFPVSYCEDGFIPNPFQEPEDVAAVLPTGRNEQGPKVKIKRESVSSHSIPSCGFHSSSSLNSRSAAAAGYFNDPSLPASTSCHVSEESKDSGPNTTHLTSHRKTSISKATRKDLGQPCSPPSPEGPHIPGITPYGYSPSVISSEQPSSGLYLSGSSPKPTSVPLSSSLECSLNKAFPSSGSGFSCSSWPSSEPRSSPSSGLRLIPLSGPRFRTSESSLIASSDDTAPLTNRHPSFASESSAIHDTAPLTNRHPSFASELTKIHDIAPSMNINRHPSFASESSISPGMALDHGSTMFQDHMPFEQGHNDYQMLYPRPKNWSHQFSTDSDTTSMLMEREWMLGYSDNAAMMQSQGLGTSQGKLPSVDTLLVPEVTTTAAPIQTDSQSIQTDLQCWPNGSDPLLPHHGQ